MSRLFVPVSGRHNQHCEATLADLKRMGAERVFLSIEERYPFERGERRDRILADLKKKVEFYADAGLEVGVWIDTLGFGGATTSYNQRAASRYTRIRSIIGRERDDAFCPFDDAFTDMMCELISDIVAVTRTRILMLDDELCLSVRPGIGCACEKHLAEYSRRIGEKIDLADLPYKAFSGVSSRYRTVFMDLMRDTLTAFCRRVREAVDQVDPTVRVGFCSGYTSWDLEGLDAMELTRILAGQTKPFLRFTGAPYWHASRRFERQSLQTVVECTRMQYALCRDSGIEVFTEADTYPRDRFHTPAAYGECFDLATRVSDNMDALKYVYEYSNQPTYDRGYVEQHLGHLGLYEGISKMFDTKQAVGVRVYETVRKLKLAELPVIRDRAFTHDDEKRVERMLFSPAQAILTSHAIPTTYEGSGVCGISFGENARYLTEEDLKKGMILDAKAASILQARGIDTGLISAKECPNHFLECYGDGEDVLLFDSPGVFQLTLKQSARVLSHFAVAELYSEESYPAAYQYENKNGQRFLVFAFSGEDLPDHSSLLRSYSRGRQIADAIPWLGGEVLPVRCDGHPLLYCLCKEEENKLAAAYINCHPDEIFDARVRTAMPIRAIRFLGCTGKQIDENELLIDHIAPYGFAAFEIT